MASSFSMTPAVCVLMGRLPQREDTPVLMSLALGAEVPSVCV